MKQPHLVTAAVVLLACPTNGVSEPMAIGAAAEGVIVKLRSGTIIEGILVAIDTTRLAIDVKGKKMELLLEDVQSIEFQSPPSRPAAVQQAGIESELPQDLTVWVIDRDSRFSSRVYHTRDCPYLTNHTARPVRVKDLVPNSIQDDCVKRLRQSLQGRSATFIDQAMKSSAFVPDTAPKIVPPARSLGVTVSGYYALTEGISYLEANSILGQSGDQVRSSSVGELSTIVYVWNAGNAGRIVAIFQNDKLVSKSQSSLP